MIDTAKVANEFDQLQNTKLKQRIALMEHENGNLTISIKHKNQTIRKLELAVKEL